MKDDVVIYPTDTVWGIGGAISSYNCFLRICDIKKTDSTKPVSILFGSIEQLKQYVHLDTELLQLFDFEVTLGISLSQFNKKIPSWIYGNSSFVGVRFVKGLINTNQYILNANEPIITTSLNLHGEMPAVNLDEAKKFCENNISKRYLLVEDDIICSGNSSTLVDVTCRQLIRKGRYAPEIEKHLQLLSA